jgi:hypothetical protein
VPSQKVADAYVSLTLQTAAFKQAIGEASGEMRKFSASMRAESAKSRESVKLLSEELSLGIPRGLQKIVSTLPGVTTAMSGVNGRLKKVSNEPLLSSLCGHAASLSRGRVRVRCC